MRWQWASEYDWRSRGTVSLHEFVKADSQTEASRYSHDDAEAPPVGLRAIAGLKEHFWRDVVRRAHGGVGQRTSVPLPRLCAPLGIHSRRRRWNWKSLTWRFHELFIYKTTRHKNIKWQWIHVEKNGMQRVIFLSMIVNVWLRTEVGRSGAWQVPVEVGAVALFEAGAKAEVTQLDVPARVQQ